MPDKINLGKHKGKPILKKTLKVTNTGDGLTKTMEIVPIAIEDGSHHYVSMHLKHTRTYYDNVFSSDPGEEDKLIGYDEITQFTALGAVFDDREDAAQQVLEMEERVRAKAKAEADEKAEKERLAKEAKEGVQRLEGGGPKEGDDDTE